MATLMCMSLAGCDFAKDYPKHIQEFPGPWQVLDPGKPLDKFPKIELIEQGAGEIVEPGDILQIHLYTKRLSERTLQERGEWWLWIGFRSPKETAFFSNEPGIASALVGMRQGGLLRFLEPKGNWISAGQLRPNPLGDPKYYSWRKNTQDFAEIYVPNDAGYYSVLEIKRVCKGEARYRTVRLFDDSPVRVCRGLDCSVSREPREDWTDEARIEAACQDGRKVSFTYGPTYTISGKDQRTQVRGYFDAWYRDAWKKIPLGVQFEGNKPPILPSLAVFVSLTTNMDTPIKVNVVDKASDPDGDRLTMRSLGSPINGTLAPNPDGSFTYTPKPGWSGSEDLTFKASDGLVEADGVVRVSIYVKKPAP